MHCSAGTELGSRGHIMASSVFYPVVARCVQIRMFYQLAGQYANRPVHQRYPQGRGGSGYLALQDT